ncbi:hypothetical protein D3C87_125990 [compost metagenome]
MNHYLTFKKILLAAGLMSLVACNASIKADGLNGKQREQGAADYRSEAAAGMINGAGWVFLSGTARPQYNDSSRLSLSLYNEDFTDPCSGFSYGRANVLTSVPARVGETVLGEMPDVHTVTFSYVNEDGSGGNMIAYDGRLAITEITAETVSGFIIAEYDRQSFINGSFKLKVCER